MEHQTTSISRPDAPDLFARAWTEPPELRARVALVHGIHEHSGRYAYPASRWLDRGVETYAVDLRGHGSSDGPRGRVQHFGAYVADARALVEWTLTATPTCSTFLMGHSMGGLVVARYLIEHGWDGLSGVILSSAALRVPAETPALLVRLAPLLARFAPALRVTSVPMSHLSRDPRVGEQYQADPLTITQRVEAQTGHAILDAIQSLDANLDAFDGPLFLFHGSDDRVTTPTGSAWLAEQAPSDDVTHRVWPGLRHETLNEPERDRVIDAVADWVLERSGPA